MNVKLSKIIMHFKNSIKNKKEKILIWNFSNEFIEDLKVLKRKEQNKFNKKTKTRLNFDSLKKKPCMIVKFNVIVIMTITLK